MQYTLGIWLVDSQNNKIKNTQTDTIIRMSPRDMQVLHYFLQNPRKVISLDELIEHVWKGRVVGDHAVYRVINKIRKHLDPEDKDAYIETIPKMGYKIIQQVISDSNVFKLPSENQGFEKDQQTEALILNQKNSKAQKKYKSWSYISLFMVLIFLLAVFSWKKIVTPQDYMRDIKIFNAFSPLLTLPGLQDYPSSSANGKYVVFSYKEKTDDAFNIYLKNMLEGTITKITDSSENDIRARVSNDAKNIFFVSRVGTDCRVVRYKSFNNQYRREDLFNCIGNEDIDFEINPDGSKIFYTYKDSINQVNRIYSMITNTGERTQITNYLSNQAIGDTELVYSEELKKLYFIRKPTARKSAIYEFDFEKSREKNIFTIDGQLTDLNIRAHSHNLTYKKNATSVTEYSIRFGQEKELLSSLNEKIYSYDFIAPEDKILVVSGTEENSLWQKNVNSSFGLEQLTLSNYRDSMPRFANKSDAIAFISERSGQQEIWLKNSSEDSEYQLTNFTNRAYINWLRWSPDDQYLLSTDGVEIFITHLESGEVSDIKLDQIYMNPRMPTWSQDGQSIYFSAEYDSEIQAFKYDISQETIEQFSNTGIVTTYDRGHLGLYFVKAHRKGLWSIINNSEELLIDDIGSSSFLQSIEFGRDGIYFIKDTSNEVYYLAYGSITNNVLPGNINLEIPNHLFSLNADSDKLIYSQSSKYNTNILISK